MSSSRVQVLSKPKRENIYIDIYKSKQVGRRSPQLPACQKGHLKRRRKQKQDCIWLRMEGADRRQDGRLQTATSFPLVLCALSHCRHLFSYLWRFRCSARERCKCGSPGRRLGDQTEFFPLQSLLTIFARLDNKTQSEVSSLKLFALLRFAWFI